MIKILALACVLLSGCATTLTHPATGDQQTCRTYVTGNAAIAIGATTALMWATLGAAVLANCVDQIRYHWCVYALEQKGYVK